MRFVTSPTSRTASRLNRAAAGFTLAEVLAALLFMAIVIPVAVGGLHVASRAGVVAQRKTAAVRVAERLLNESIITTNIAQSVQNGTLTEDTLEFRYIVRPDSWPSDMNQTAPRLLTVEVTYAVQGQDYHVRLSTLTAQQ
jgi:type II secretory pathway pseudopilin PulG